MRVIVYGGDERTERVPWPRSVDVHAYAHTPKNLDKVAQSVRARPPDKIIVLTKHTSHSAVASLQSLNVPIVRYVGSSASLGEELEGILGVRPPNPLEVPSPAERKPAPNSFVIPDRIMRSMEAAVAARAEAEAKLSSETFGQALRRLMIRDHYDQAMLSRQIGCGKTAISHWIRGKNLPSTAAMAWLRGRWPELERFGAGKSGGRRIGSRNRTREDLGQDPRPTLAGAIRASAVQVVMERRRELLAELEELELELSHLMEQ